MTELTNTSERQSSYPMDSGSEADDIRPDPKRRRTRRGRWYLLATIPVMFLTLMVCVAATLPAGCTLQGHLPEPETGVFFDVDPFLADEARTVHARACVRERYSGLKFAMPKPSSSCASFIVYADLPLHREDPYYDEVDPWSDGAVNQGDPRRLFIEEPPLTWEQPVAVRLTMTDQAGNSIFDSSAVVQPYTVSYEPSCYGVKDVARVVATPAGGLAPYKVWQPNS